LIQQNKVEEADSIEEQFHSLILKTSGSQLLSRMHVVISRYFAETTTRISSFGLVNSKDAIEHQKIAEAFGNRDAETVRRLLERHLRLVLDHLESEGQTT
ncbi:MAG: FCD domain-containing protein, partial [Candidatus Latescibacteria bacterium]|nr:FCD domain-containing protein [Candidatus Latescibacterota bacterium]